MAYNNKHLYFSGLGLCVNYSLIDLVWSHLDSFGLGCSPAEGQIQVYFYISSSAWGKNYLGQVAEAKKTKPSGSKEQHI